MDSIIAICGTNNNDKTNITPKRNRVPTRRYLDFDSPVNSPKTPKRKIPSDDDEPTVPDAPKKPRTSRKKEKEEDVQESGVEYQGTVETLDDLIALAEDKTSYSNIDMKALRRIKDYLEELRDMVGLKSLKETIVAQIIYYLQGLHKGSEDYMHTCIYGGPGTGKTTVAEIIGLIFANLGVLKTKKFISARREDLVAGYLGQTAIKTAIVMEAARGGVLFIDEIYSLGSKEGRDSFAKEAIDTINLVLSENKGDFMMIIGGYEKEVDECFFSQNPGLRRRFMWYHKIDNYSEDELADMFCMKVHELGWSLDKDVNKEWLSPLLKKNKVHFKDMGGSVENFITLVKVQHSKRIFGKDPALKKVVSKDDIQASMDKMNKDKKPTSEPSPPPAMMYL